MSLYEDMTLADLCEDQQRELDRLRAEVERMRGNLQDDAMLAELGDAIFAAVVTRQSRRQIAEAAVRALLASTAPKTENAG